MASAKRSGLARRPPGKRRRQPPLPFAAQQAIHARMRERHLNNEQLAVALSLELGEAVSNSTVSRWLNGEVGPQSDVVVALAKILGFPRAYLLDLSAGGDGAPAPLEQQLAIVLQQQQQMAARLHELERQARK